MLQRHESMTLIFSMIVVAGAIHTASRCWERVVPKTARRETRRLVWIWALKGLGVPTLAWMVLNAGFSKRLPPLMTQVADIWAAGGNWFQAWTEACGQGVWVIATWWMAVSSGWLLATLPERLEEEERRGVRALLTGTSLVIAPLALVAAWTLGAMQWGTVAAIWLLLLAWQAADLFVEPDLPPSYSRAMTKMRQGRTNEAEWEIIQTLEQHEEDFDGWMMLAELYATQYHDLAVADETVREVCRQPITPAPQIALALHRLADWHLKLGRDPLAARAALEELCRLLPGTHLSQMAWYRLRQIPTSREALLEQLQGKPIHLPSLRSLPDATFEQSAELLSREAAIAKANECTARLQKDPDDTRAREDLAHTFADDLGQMDQALEQLELLLGMPRQAQEQTVEWLALLASWQLRNRRDEEAGRRTLDRLIHEYPQSPQAFVAQRRLNLMDMEQKIRRTRERAATVRRPIVVPKLAHRPEPPSADTEWPR